MEHEERGKAVGRLSPLQQAASFLDYELPSIPSLLSLDHIHQLDGDVPSPRKQLYDAMVWNFRDEQMCDSKPSPRKDALLVAMAHKNRCRVIRSTPQGQAAGITQLDLDFPPEESIEALSLLPVSDIHYNGKSGPHLMILTISGKLYRKSIEPHLPKITNSAPLQAKDVMKLTWELPQNLTGIHMKSCRDIPGLLVLAGESPSQGGSSIHVLQNMTGPDNETWAAKPLEIHGVDTVSATISCVYFAMQNSFQETLAKSIQSRFWSMQFEDQPSTLQLQAFVFVGLADGTVWASGLYYHEGASNNRETATITQGSKAHMIGYLPQSQAIAEICFMENPTGFVENITFVGASGDLAVISSNGTLHFLPSTLSLSCYGASWTSAIPIRSTQGGNDNHRCMVWATKHDTGATHLLSWKHDSATGNTIEGSIAGTLPLPIRSDLQFCIPVRKHNSDEQLEQYFMGVTKGGGLQVFQVPCTEYTMMDWICSPYGRYIHWDNAATLQRGTLRQSCQRNQTQGRMGTIEQAKEQSRQRIKRYLHHSSALESMLQEKQESELTAHKLQTAEVSKAMQQILQAQHYESRGQHLRIQRSNEDVSGHRVAAVQLQRGRHSSSTNYIFGLNPSLHFCEATGSSVTVAKRDTGGDVDAEIHFGGVAYSVNVPFTAGDALSAVHRFALPPLSSSTTPRSTTFVSLTPNYSAMGHDTFIRSSSTYAGEMGSRRESQSQAMKMMIIAEQTVQDTTPHAES